MLATIDFWTVSGWVIGAASFGLAMFAFIKDYLSRRERDETRRALRSVRHALNALHASIVDAHSAEDVIKTDAGKRLLVALAYQMTGIRLQIEEALGEPHQVPPQLPLPLPPPPPAPQPPATFPPQPPHPPPTISMRSN